MNRLLPCSGWPVGSQGVPAGAEWWGNVRRGGEEKKMSAVHSRSGEGKGRPAQVIYCRVSDETLEIGPGRMKGNRRSAVNFPASLARVPCGFPGWAKQGVGEGD